MHEMTLKSLGIFVGTGECNARCKHCAGIPLRKYAPKNDGIIDSNLISKTIESCYIKGARSLSISSSGEPTLSPISVTKVLEIIHSLRLKSVIYDNVNLYSNGIRIGEDNNFCNDYLSLWKELGLKRFHITVHDVNPERNAIIYGVNKYPDLGLIINRIHCRNMSVRANLVLNNEAISSLKHFSHNVNHLLDMGFDYISSWQIRNNQDVVDKSLSPKESELDRIDEWIKNHKYRDRIRLLRDKNRETYNLGEKLTLFTNGTLSNSWCS